MLVALVAGLVGSSGLDVGGRLLFALAAAAAFAFAVAETDLGDLVRHPAVAALGALAAFEFASLGWTIGDVGDGAWWAVSVLAAALLTVAAAAVTKRHGGVLFLAGAICLLAAGSAAVGVVAVAAERAPWAECLSGVWRAGGPLQYPPALALLQVSAAPMALCWMCGTRRLAALGGAVVGGLAVGAIALSGSRTPIALGGLLALCFVLRPGLLGASRGQLTAAAAAAIAVGLSLVAVARSDLGWVSAVAVMALVLVAAAVGWVHLRERQRLRLPAAGLAVAAALALTVGATAASPAQCGVPPDGGFAHGRIALWQSAGQTALERPLLGAGAAAFLPATAERQGDAPVRFGHSLPIELAVELGGLGVVAWLGLMGGLVVALRRVRGHQALALLGPAAVAFPLANLVDWSWHLVGALAVWSVALGGLIGARHRP